MMIMGLIFVPSILAILVLTALYFIKKDWVSFLDFLPFLDFTDDTNIELMPFREPTDAADAIRSNLSRLSNSLGSSGELALTSTKPGDDETPDLIIQKVTITLDEDASATDMWNISEDDSFKHISTTGMTKDALEDAVIEVHVLVLSSVVEAAQAADDDVTYVDASTARLPVFSVVKESDGTTPKTYTKTGAASTDSTAGFYNKLKVGPYTVDDLEDDGDQTDAKYMILKVPVTKRGGWDTTDPGSPSATDPTTVVDSIHLRFEVDELPEEDDA
jgi:hypothetical protein